MVKKMVGYSKFSRIHRPFHVLGAEHVVLRKRNSLDIVFPNSAAFSHG